MKKAEPTTSRLSQVISDKMEEKGLTIKQLSEALDIVYEHTRRIVRGESIPSRFVLKEICKQLGLDYKELQDMADTAKITAKYGDLPYSLASKDPTMEPLERVWPNLTDQQRGDIIAMAQGWAKRARAC